jgi:hypothetical protein
MGKGGCQLWFRVFCLLVVLQLTVLLQWNVLAVAQFGAAFGG